MDSLGHPTPNETPAERGKRIRQELAKSYGIADRWPDNRSKSWLRIRWEADPCCHWCKRLTIWSGNPSGVIPRTAATRDHVISRNKLQPGESSPVVLACYDCNQRRNTEELTAIPHAERQRASMAAQLAVEQFVGERNESCATSASATVEAMTTPISVPRAGEEQRSAPLEGASDIASQLRRLYGVEEILPSPPAEVIRECPLCWRRNLRDKQAFWQHVISSHEPEELNAHVFECENGTFESALISVCNSETLEDAVRIATEALSREELPE